MASSGNIRTELPSNASGVSKVFPGRGGVVLTIHLSVAATGSPTGSFALELENAAEPGTWGVVADADLSGANPAAGAAEGSFNFKNPPLGKLRVAYTSTSDGSADADAIVVHVEYAKV